MLSVRGLLIALAIAATATFAGVSQAASTPVVPLPPSAPDPSIPSFVGSPWSPQAFPQPLPPQDPFLAPNGTGELHDDGYQSDAYATTGPLGRGMKVISADENGECASITFDSHGRVVAVCVQLSGPQLVMLDPHTLATLATYPLPPRQPGSKNINPFQNFTGGGYFYLDNRDEAVIPTTTRHILVVGETPGRAGFTLKHDYNVSGVVASGDSITSVLPDWNGDLVFESFNGVVGTINPRTGRVRSVALNEETENSFAIDETGAVFIVSNKAMYRLRLAADGTPRVTWRVVYPNSGIHEPGQIDAGSGTTPTVQGPYVTITDNANPIDIVVYRRSTGSRVCVQPIFSAGHSADENSLIGVGNVMIAENNYGYTGPAATEGGATTAPGIERVDIDPRGDGCHVEWLNSTEHVPTLVSKLSLANGLVYAYTKDSSSSLDPWYFTALDVRSGRIVYKQLAGEGATYNNNYAGVALGPNGSAYVGVIGGIVELRDATPASAAHRARPPGYGGASRLSDQRKGRGPAQSCSVPRHRQAAAPSPAPRAGARDRAPAPRGGAPPAPRCPGPPPPVIHPDASDALQNGRSMIR
jgi:hypothetical protein